MKIKGLLIDLDGVVYNDSQPIAGANETIRWLMHRNIPFRFVTNTTMKHRSTLVKKLNSMGINISADVLFSAAYAAAQYLKQFANHRAMLLLSGDAKREFEDIEEDERDVDFVVLGDMGDDFTLEKINRAFNCLMSGAQLIALQKNRFWLSDQGYRIDAGAFVAMLEYAAKVESVLIGKPSARFFQLALDDLKLAGEEVLMIGDDVESDIMGAQRLGIRTCLVKTGKFRQQDVDRAEVKPDHIIESIARLPALLQDAGL